MTPLADGQDSPSSTGFTLSFNHPGKARRRTRANWTQFATITIRLQDDQWTTESPDSIQPKLKAVKPGRKLFHDALVDAITLHATGPGQTSKATWESECTRRSLMQSKGTSTDPESKRTQSFRAAIYDLQAAGWIGCSGDTFTDLTRKYRP
jgi:hypothetical protein